MESTPEDQRYRREQEEFVSNHGGTTPWEIVLVILPSVCAILLTTTIIALFRKFLHGNILPVIEFSIAVVPCVLCCTIFSEYTVEVSATMLTISFINFLLIIWTSKVESNTDIVDPGTKRRTFLTHFRALTNITTAICILAVDFKIFPRKFAKTEVYGYSLMDTGVGLFIIANALVAPQARDFNTRKSSFFQQFSNNTKEAIRSSTILLVLGIARFIAIEFLGYQRHVTEYGVHWNFFVTLAIVKMFTSTIASAVSSKYSLLSGMWIIAMHEYALTTKGLKEWVLGNAPREDFVSANREGLVSIPGYVGLYFVGISIGRLIHSTYILIDEKEKKTKKRVGIEAKVFGKTVTFEYNKSMVLCIKLSLITPHACAVSLICDTYFGVSRRLANSGYCTWILTLSAALLTLLLLVEIITDVIIHSIGSPPAIHKTNKMDLKNRNKGSISNHENGKIINRRVMKKALEIFEAVNYNGMAFFLLSNLTTGLINICMKTLYIEPIQALLILICYIGAGIFVTIIFYRYRIQIKL